MTIIVAFIIVVNSSSSKVHKKTRDFGEENALKLIKQFIKSKGWKKNDYLLVNNLILQKEGYWSCEIDIVLLTKKWVYIIEVKDWKRGRLSGRISDEYLELSFKVGKQQTFQKHEMYSPFYQNQQHINRFKSYFKIFDDKNIISIICFNNPNLEIDLKDQRQTIFTNKHMWINNGNKKNIASLIKYYENKSNKFSDFKDLKKQINKEIIVSTSTKVEKHNNWLKTIKEKKEY